MNILECINDTISKYDQQMDEAKTATGNAITAGALGSTVVLGAAGVKKGTAIAKGAMKTATTLQKKKQDILD